MRNLVLLILISFIFAKTIFREDKPKDLIETLTKEENHDKKNVKIEEATKKLKKEKIKTSLKK